MLAKLTVPFNTSITDLISKAPESPGFLQLRNSINYLKVKIIIFKFLEYFDYFKLIGWI